ncbi:unnamed protein product [Ceutorhynchus assimilis]|uniref:ODAD1 central coiled coil region domain-containing protein n=1 Tax=Ceutorhynchus assimilis TaxID=467358 RepID=A0A9N9ME50_9CUCU|nr:unnamed protein product [Ceutorhynchus assimilis]
MTTQEEIPLTEEEKYELALQTEHELARLSRTYTIMERHRAEFMQADLGGKLAKHKKVLDIFKREQKNILTDLAVASAEARTKEDLKKSRKLAYLLNEYDDFGEQIKKEKNYTKEIEDQIQMVKKKCLELAARQISDDKYQERVLKGEQIVQTLENKLEVQIKKFCVICAENVRLRSEIHHLLNERNEFNKIWERLIKNLCIGKKFMIDLIEQATIAYDQREEWVSKLQILRTKANNDLVLHIQEMRELQRKGDNDVKLQEFFAIKGQKRIMRDLAELQLQKRLENKLHINRNLENYLKLLIEIKEFAELDNIPEIARNFVHHEEDNFAKFKYVNDLNKQMEELSDELAERHSRIDKQSVLHQVFNKQQQETLENLEKKVDEKQKETAKKEAELKGIDTKLNNIMTGIGSLFRLFRCDNDPIIHMLGHNETIHHYNAVLYLQILERTIHEALVTVHSKALRPTSKKKGAKAEPHIVRQDIKPEVIEPVERICTTNPCPLCVEHDLVSDVIDELQVAYTKDQIQAKLKRRLKIEGARTGLHNVSACHLPKSRQIIQKRYQ